MSLLLKEVLRNWLTDATSTSPSDKVKKRGLCFYVGINLEGELFEELGHLNFPFDATVIDHIKDREKHLNPRRLAFVRSYLNIT